MTVPLVFEKAADRRPVPGNMDEDRNGDRRETGASGLPALDALTRATPAGRPSKGMFRLTLMPVPVDAHVHVGEARRGTS